MEHDLNVYFFNKSKIYSHVSKNVSPSMLGTILKKPLDSKTFLPKIGLFATEFSIGYCYNLHKAKKSEKINT